MKLIDLIEHTFKKYGATWDGRLYRNKNWFHTSEDGASFTEAATEAFKCPDVEAVLFDTDHIGNEIVEHEGVLTFGPGFLSQHPDDDRVWSLHEGGVLTFGPGFLSQDPDDDWVLSLEEQMPSLLDQFEAVVISGELGMESWATPIEVALRNPPT